MRLFDRLYNRLIDGNIKSLSESDKALLQQEVLEAGVRSWEITDDTDLEELNQKLVGAKAGDIIYDNADGSVYVITDIMYEDDSLVYLSAYGLRSALSQRCLPCQLFYDSDGGEGLQYIYYEGPKIWTNVELGDNPLSDDFINYCKVGDIIIDSVYPIFAVVTFVDETEIDFSGIDRDSCLTVKLVYNTQEETWESDSIQVGTKLYQHTVTYQQYSASYISTSSIQKSRNGVISIISLGGFTVDGGYRFSGIAQALSVIDFAGNAVDVTSLFANGTDTVSAL